MSRSTPKSHRRLHRHLVIQTLSSRELMVADTELYASVASGGENAFHVVSLHSESVREQSVGYAGFNAGLDVDPRTGLLYAGYSSLREIDTGTGAVRNVGSFHDGSGEKIYVRGLSFSPGGVLFGISDNTLYTIDPSTARAQFVSVIDTSSPSDKVFGIEFADDGTLYAAGFQLMKVDPTTGEIVHRVGRLENYVTELDFTPEGHLLAVLGPSTHQGRIMQLDLANATEHEIARFGSDLNAIASPLIIDHEIRNSRPGLIEDESTILMGESATINVLANDSDPDGDRIELVQATDGSHGSVVVLDDRSVRYKPQPGFFGRDEFTYTVTDVRGASSTSIVHISVESREAESTSSFTLFASSGSHSATPYHLLELDSGAAEAISLGYSGYQLAADAHPVTGAVLTTNGSLLYRLDPKSGHRETVGRIHDDEGNSLRLSGISFSPDGTLYGAYYGKLFQLDPDSAMATLIGSSGKLVRSIEFASDGRLLGGYRSLYVLDPLTGAVLSAIGRLDTYFGDIDFAPDNSLYVASSSSAGQGVISRVSTRDASVLSTIVYDSDLRSLVSVAYSTLPTNTAPVADDDHASVMEDSSLRIDVLSNDSDAEGDELQIIGVNTPQNGRAVLEADGAIRYVPESNYFGADKFTYLVSDGEFTDLATVAIEVTGQNDRPTAIADRFTVAEDQVLESTEGVLFNDSDVDFDQLIAVLAEVPRHGKLQLSQSGSFLYAPYENYHGNDFFTYIARDETGAEHEATVAIHVTPVADSLVEVDREGFMRGFLGELAGNRSLFDAVEFDPYFQANADELFERLITVFVRTEVQEVALHTIVAPSLGDTAERLVAAVIGAAMAHGLQRNPLAPEDAAGVIADMLPDLNSEALNLSVQQRANLGTGLLGAMVGQSILKGEITRVLGAEGIDSNDFFGRALDDLTRGQYGSDAWFKSGLLPSLDSVFAALIEWQGTGDEDPYVPGDEAYADGATIGPGPTHESDYGVPPIDHTANAHEIGKAAFGAVLGWARGNYWGAATSGADAAEPASEELIWGMHRWNEAKRWAITHSQMDPTTLDSSDEDPADPPSDEENGAEGTGQGDGDGDVDRERNEREENEEAADADVDQADEEQSNEDSTKGDDAPEDEEEDDNITTPNPLDEGQAQDGPQSEEELKLLEETKGIDGGAVIQHLPGEAPVDEDIGGAQIPTDYNGPAGVTDPLPGDEYESFGAGIQIPDYDGSDGAVDPPPGESPGAGEGTIEASSDPSDLAGRIDSVSDPTTEGGSQFPDGSSGFGTYLPSGLPF